LSFKNKFLYISVIDEASDFKFGTHTGKAKAHQKKSGCHPGLRDLPEFGVPFNIFATVEASDFKFGAQLGLSKDHHKIRRRRKSGLALD